MNLQEKNWQNLFGNYTEEGTTWHALTTVYSLDLSVIRTYKFTRKFSANRDRSMIYHHNTYYFSEDNIKEQSWQLEKEKCNQSDGVFHPEAENMRAIDFGNNTSIWVSKILTENQNFGSEFFFKDKDWRFGIIPIYQNGSFASIVIIKENKNYFPETLDKDMITDLSGTWQIKQTHLTPTLQEALTESTINGIEFNFADEELKTYYLPEKIVLQLPQAIAVGKAFKIIVGRQMAEHLFIQITSNYDSNGQLKELVSSEFTRIRGSESPS